jgi:tRNA threonylcarbamoyladenosine modification (KEOPS) complex  Pcc1 subunit
MKIQKNNVFKISVNIEVKFSTNKERDVIMKTLLPDNIHFPNELYLEMSSNKKSLIIDISSTNISTLINTIDELLQHIKIAKKVIDHD